MKYNIFELIQNKYIEEEFVIEKFNFGRLANALSFIKTLKIFLKSKAKKCLIFEDDILIPPKKYIKVVNNYMKDLYKNQIPKKLGIC